VGAPDRIVARDDARMPEQETSPTALRAEATPAVDGIGHARLFAIDDTGADRLVAEWTRGADDADEWLTLEVAWSPSRERAAVRTGRDTWTFVVATGELVHHDAGPARTDGPLDTAFSSSPLLVWSDDEVASYHAVTRDSRLEALLAPDIHLTVVGPIVDDGGEASSGGSGPINVAFAHGTPRTEVEAELRRVRREEADANAAPMRLLARLDMRAQTTVLQDTTSSVDDGFVQLQWPLLAGPRGVLVRRSHVRSYKRGSRFEVQHPWLVTPDGTLTTLPFEFGNRPLTTLPDGHFLLPCWGAMWWDGPNEPLTALGDDGEAEPLLLDGESISPMSAVRAVEPSWVPAEDPDGYYSDDRWDFAAARVDDGRLLLALERDGPDQAERHPWLVLALPIDGTRCGPPVRIAGARPPAGTLVRVVV
jgi:hypothetical protein